MKRAIRAEFDDNEATWQTVITRLWSLNHATFKGRASMEHFEDILSEIEVRAGAQLGRSIQGLNVRRVKFRNVRRIWRLEKLLREIAVKSFNHGTQFFRGIHHYLAAID